MLHRLVKLVCLSAIVMAGAVPSADARDLSLLFIGDNGHHRPNDRFHELAPALAERGIRMKYTDDMSSITAERIADFDGLVLYANIDRIEDEQAEAVLDFVQSGKGFIPLHCATFCWRNNDEMVRLMGGQFLRHGTGTFTTDIATADHPIMAGYHSFVSWDETYIHHRHNPEGRTVLEYRIQGEQAEGNDKEPWTWIREQGRGRVFYTAWGHDQRTFSHPGFHNLVERGIRWACGDDVSVVPDFTDPERFPIPRMTEISADAPPFDFVDVGPKIPNYTPGGKWGDQGKPRTLMQQPLSPEDSLQHYVSPEGMALRLYADERSFIAKPIAMNWDEQGRLWLCETLDYPNELGTNRDRIRICEDTTGDGVADQFTVFAEGLSIPSSVLPIRGGAVVQNGTETLFLRDTDGDGIADVRKTLITGWALGDTHGGVSNMRYGLDNWIWAMQGYNNSRPEYAGGRSQSFRMGFWRFRLSRGEDPVVTDLEFIRSTDNNTWGLGISEEGLIFGSTANHNPSNFMPVANRYYERVRGWAPERLQTIADTYLFDPITDKVRQVDQFGGYTAGAGHALYTARTFPPAWWNRTAFVCGPTGHLVGTFVLSPDGAGYTSTSPCNLVASDDEWAAPIMAEVGPDGAVWILDWYNYIVQHNPTPQGFENGRGNAYESDLRDKRHGRIFRVVPVDGAEDIVHESPNLADASIEQLVAALSHPAMVVRLHAQRLLIDQRAADAAPLLIEALQDRTTDSVGLNAGVIHALRTLEGLGLITDDNSTAVDAVEALLDHPSAGVRLNAVRVLPNQSAARALISDADGPLVDDHPQVKLAAVLRASDLPANKAVGRAVAALSLGVTDRWLRDALTSAAAMHAVGFFEGMSAARQTDDSGSAPRIARIVAEHLARQKLDKTELTSLLQQLRTTSPTVRNAALAGLTEGWPSDHRLKADAELNEAFLATAGTADSGSQTFLLRIAAWSGTNVLEKFADQLVAALMEVVADEDRSVNERSRAAAEVIAFREEDEGVVEGVLEQITAQVSPQFAQAMIRAAGLSRAAGAGELMIESMESLTPNIKSVTVQTLLARAETTNALLSALGDGRLAVGELTLDQKQALQNHPNESIRMAAEKILAAGAGLPDPDRDRVLQELMPLTKKQGSVAEGRKMFEKHCSRCHQHGQLGKNIGPNLTGMAVHPKEELLTHIIDPSRSVEGNFRIYTVVTADGLVTNGMLAAETRTSVSLIDAEAREHVIPREDIEELVAGRKSLMPEGFEKQMSGEELASLLEFLTDKGRFLPVSLDRYATAVSTKGLFSEGDNGPDRMVFPDWKPKMLGEIPFVLTDPRGKTVPNVILLNGPFGPLPPRMPKSVRLPCNSSATALHLLSGVGGWSYPYLRDESVSMIVRLHYTNGETEDHSMVNGIHFADYIRRVDVEGSQFAFALGSQQIRHLTVTPKKSMEIREIELIKGEDVTAPIVMALTVERP